MLKDKARLPVIGLNSFKDMVKKNVKEEAIIITDQHSGYKGLDAEYVELLTVNHNEMQFRYGLAIPIKLTVSFPALNAR